MRRNNCATGQSLNSQGIYCVLIKRNLLGPTASIPLFSRSFRPRYSKIDVWSFEPNGNFFRNLKMSFQTTTINFRQSFIASLNKLTLICNGNGNLKQISNARATTKTNYCYIMFISTVVFIKLRLN